jgi:hypothetical protein
MSYEYQSQHLGELKFGIRQTAPAVGFATILNGRFVAPVSTPVRSGPFTLARSNIRQSVPALVGSSPGPGVFMPAVPVTAVTPAPVPIVTTVSSDVPFPGRVDYSGAPLPGTVEATPLPAGTEVTTAGTVGPAAAGLPSWLPLLGLAASAFFLLRGMRKRKRARR